MIEIVIGALILVVVMIVFTRKHMKKFNFGIVLAIILFGVVQWFLVEVLENKINQVYDRVDQNDNDRIDRINHLDDVLMGLVQQLPLKERCRFKKEHGLPFTPDEGFDMNRIYLGPDRKFTCDPYLEKTPEAYKIP